MLRAHRTRFSYSIYQLHIHLPGILCCRRLSVGLHANSMPIRSNWLNPMQTAYRLCIRSNFECDYCRLAMFSANDGIMAVRQIGTCRCRFLFDSSCHFNCNRFPQMIFIWAKTRRTRIFNSLTTNFINFELQIYFEMRKCWMPRNAILG